MLGISLFFTSLVVSLVKATMAASDLDSALLVYTIPTSHVVNNHAFNHGTYYSGWEKRNSISHATGEEEVKLEKRMLPRVHGAIHYARKGDQYEEKLGEDLSNKEWLRKMVEQTDRRNGILLNRPKESAHVIKTYDEKIKAAQEKVNAGKGDQRLKDKMKIWDRKRYLWQVRHDSLSRFEKKANSEGMGVRPEDPEQVASLGLYYEDRDRERKASSQSEQGKNKAVKLYHDDNEEGDTSQEMKMKAVVEDVPHHSPKMEKAVESGSISDRKEMLDMGNKRKHDEALGKSSGSGSDDPESSAHMIKYYQDEIESAKIRLHKGEADAKHLHRLMNRFASPRPGWRQEERRLRREKKNQLAKESYKVRKLKVEKKGKGDTNDGDIRKGKGAGPIEKRAIHDPAYHYQKADGKEIDRAKWQHNLVKAEGARWNVPSYSQDVVKSYRLKMQEAQNKLQTMPGGSQESSKVVRKIMSWDDKMLEWEKRRNLLRSDTLAKKSSQSDSISNSETEKKVKEYHDNWQSRPFTFPDAKYDLDQHFHKRTIDALDYMKKTDEIAARPANTDVEESEKNRKWIENLIKTQGARYNTPGDSAAVVKMYNGKVDDALMHHTGEDKEGLLNAKVNSWLNKSASWQQRREKLADELLEREKSGTFQPRDAEIERDIEKYQDQKRRIEKQERRKARRLRTSMQARPY